jgi:coenzyme F420-reducing hydrogenase delta subunit/NAD-dependent dihydropyrimidine dehydrogenase PreA subunit
MCVRCLTCYRLCPHKAIELGTRLSVVEQACEGCGICAAECPRGAISMDGQNRPDEAALVSGVARQSAGEGFIPAIAAFCCHRSAARAAELALNMGHKLPQGLQMVEVPCGGWVSSSHILDALENHADGVMVLTCHEGNCYSERGHRCARQRADHIKQLFASMGLETERVLSLSFASNMGVEFARALAEFEARLSAMGPSGLKKETA